MTYAANDEVTVSAVLTDIRHTKSGETVTATLRIHGTTGKLVAANLECFVLHVGQRKSQSIWVDSFMDVQRGDYPARKGMVAVDVYWAMPDDVKVTAADLRDAKLAIENPFLSPCFKFAAS